MLEPSGTAMKHLGQMGPLLPPRPPAPPACHSEAPSRCSEQYKRRCPRSCESWRCLMTVSSWAGRACDAFPQVEHFPQVRGSVDAVREDFREVAGGLEVEKATLVSRSCLTVLHGADARPSGRSSCGVRLRKHAWIRPSVLTRPEARRPFTCCAFRQWFAISPVMTHQTSPPTAGMPPPTRSGHHASHLLWFGTGEKLSLAGGG